MLDQRQDDAGRAREIISGPDPSRRGVLLAAGAVLLAFPGVRAALPTAAGTGRAGAGAAGAGTGTGPAHAAYPFVAYHGVTGAGHQQRFDQLVPQGYRMVSLSVYDVRPPLYAAVWVQRTGPRWLAYHGLSAAQYQARFNDVTPLGYVPLLISATGPGSNATFAVVFEQLAVSPWLARHGLVDGSEDAPGTLANVHRWARANNCIPRTIAIYGTGAADRTYAGVWLPNPAQTQWHHHPMGDAAGYQAWFNYYTQLGLRPAYVDTNDGLQYAGLFTSDSIGPWVARHGMTSAGYQSEFDAQRLLGRMPIFVQGGGTGSGVRYTAVFAAQPGSQADPG